MNARYCFGDEVRWKVKSFQVAGIDISTCHFINGERISSEQTLKNTSPIDGQFLGDFALGDTNV